MRPFQGAGTVVSRSSTSCASGAAQQRVEPRRHFFRPARLDDIIIGAGVEAWPLVQRWRQLGTERDVEVFRANHHGSGYSNTRQLLTALDPEVILYSAQAGNGHPTRDAVTRGKETAIAYATGLDPATWTPAAFISEGGSVVGEIRLFVAPDGASYTVSGRSFRSFFDTEERAETDNAR